MAESFGKVIQIAGPAVDVQFAQVALPPIYQALRVVSEGFDVPAPIDVILEVQQHLGEGRVRAPGTVTFDVPAGVLEGMDLRVAGQGNAGFAGGPAGDLIVGVEVEPSEAFERQGHDLYGVLDVTITQATLGGDVEIETLDGPERLEIEAGIESGTVLRVKGKGVPHLQRRGRGDLFVTLHIVTPRDLSKEERSLLQRLAELRGEPASGNGAAPRDLRRPEYRS